MLDYKRLLEGKGKFPGYKRTDPEYYINQIPIAEEEHQQQQTSSFSLKRHMRQTKLFLKVVGLVVILALMAFMHVRGDFKLVREHRPETFEQTQEKVQHFYALQEKLAEMGISTRDTFAEESSPQHMALDWMVHHDKHRLVAGMLMPPGNDNGKSIVQFIQRYVLAVLYFSTGGPTLWTKQMNWMSDHHVCEWKDDGGVRKCTADRQVLDISLWNNLHGTIPLELTKLPSLHVLYLSRNTLTGTLPSEFGAMQKLNYLGLQHNKLYGTVPTELGQLQQLSYLGLERNDFTGTIGLDHPICKLRGVGTEEKATLSVFTTDCRGIKGEKPPEIQCECCTECFRY